MFPPGHRMVNGSPLLVIVDKAEWARVTEPVAKRLHTTIVIIHPLRAVASLECNGDS